MNTVQRFAFLLLACFGLICRWVALIPRWTANDEIRSAPTNRREKPIPRPVQILKQYQRWHSEESLQGDQRDRKYAVVFYACPLQAGNRIHHFLTGMLWSILTNRTMLWKYYDAESCSLYGSCCSPLVCRTANVREDCDPILTRAHWIPSYDKWHAKLNLPEPVELPYYTTHPPDMHEVLLPWGPGNDESVQGIDVLHKNTTVVVFPQMRYKASWMANKSIAHTLLHSDWSRALNQELYSMGSDFLFGMLQHHSLQLTDQIRASAIPQDAYSTYQRPHDYHTIALHSRHHYDIQHGCDIDQEQKCIKGILNTLQKQTLRDREQKTCVVSLMSDRNCTIERLKTWLQQELNCIVFVALHEDAGYDYKFEHGPFAGAGFYEDLALASMARSAFIGTDRSSSDLVAELIVFHRVMEAWKAASLEGRLVDLQLLSNPSASLPICTLDYSEPPSWKLTGGPSPKTWVANLRANGTISRSFKVHTPESMGPSTELPMTLTVTPRVSCLDPNLSVTVTPMKLRGPIGTVFELNETLEMKGCVNSTCHVSFSDASGVTIGTPQIVTVACDRPGKRCYDQVVLSCSCPFNVGCAEATIKHCGNMMKKSVTSVLTRYKQVCSRETNSSDQARIQRASFEKL